MNLTGFHDFNPPAPPAAAGVQGNAMAPAPSTNLAAPSEAASLQGFQHPKVAVSAKPSLHPKTTAQIIQEEKFLDKAIETILSKMSKAFDLIGRVEIYKDPANPHCRANANLGSTKIGTLCHFIVAVLVSSWIICIITPHIVGSSPLPTLYTGKGLTLSTRWQVLHGVYMSI